MEINFLHTSDWHLGMNLSYLTPDKASFKRDSALKAISSMVSQSLSEKIDLIFLCGDIFENPNPSTKLKKDFFRMINPLVDAGIRIFLVPGNHDYYSKDGLWDDPDFDRIHIFKQEGFSFFNLDEFNITIWGVPVFKANQDKNWLRFPPGVDSTRKNILLYHADYQGTGLEDDQWYYPFKLDDLPGLPFDYIALGHHHRFNTINVENRLKAAYSGAPVGWSFGKRDLGPRTFITGRIADTDVEIKTIELPGSRMQRFELNSKFPREIEKVFTEIDKISSDDFVKIEIIGSENIDEILEKAESYQNRFQYLKIEKESTIEDVEQSDNHHLSLILKYLDERFSKGEINEDFHSRLRARAIRLFME